MIVHKVWLEKQVEFITSTNMLACIYMYYVIRYVRLFVTILSLSVTLYLPTLIPKDLLVWPLSFLTFVNLCV